MSEERLDLNELEVFIKISDDIKKVRRISLLVINLLRTVQDIVDTQQELIQAYEELNSK